MRCGEARAFLLEVQRLSRAGGWRYDRATDVVESSPEIQRAYAIQPGEDISRPPFWFDRIHPEDRPRVQAQFEQSLHEKTEYRAGYRIVLPDGSIRYQYATGHPVTNDAGDLVEFIGASMDMTEHWLATTERGLAEEALRKSEERWRAVFENSAIGVALTDQSGRFLATNSAFQKMLGYTEEEIGKLTFLELTHEDYRESNWQLVTELLEGKRRQFQIEKQYRRKDGSLIWVSNNVSLVPGTKSMPRFLMALSEDITERKQTEETLRRTQAELAQVTRVASLGEMTAPLPMKSISRSPPSSPTDTPACDGCPRRRRTFPRPWRQQNGSSRTARTPARSFGECAPCSNGRPSRKCGSISARSLGRCFACSTATRRASTCRSMSCWTPISRPSSPIGFSCSNWC